MSVIQVTSREFREKQASLFELADKGENIVIRRGKKQAYVLTPLDDNDLYFTPEMLAKIDASIEQAKAGEVYRMQGDESLDDFLERVGNV